MNDDYNVEYKNKTIVLLIIDEKAFKVKTKKIAM